MSDVVETTDRPDVSLPALLAARAHGASTRRLVLDLVLGGGAATAVLVARPKPFLALSGAALCFAAFGAWGLADRALTARHARASENVADQSQEYMPDFTRRAPIDAAAVAYRGIGMVAVITGVAALMTMLFGVLALMLGTIIS